MSGAEGFLLGVGLAAIGFALECRRLRRESERQIARIDALAVEVHAPAASYRKLLRALEWSGERHADGSLSCPYCRHAEMVGHDLRCELGLALVGSCAERRAEHRP